MRGHIMKKTQATEPAKAGLLKRDDQESGKATFPELFFDLVFVFALIQLSHTLAEDFGTTALIEAAILILALWWLWINTTWLTNLLNTEKEVVRLLLFAMMFGGILLAIAIPEAFAEQGMVFAVIYSAIQIGRTCFALYVFKGIDDENYRIFARIAVWLVFSSLFWFAGGLADLHLRIVLWTLAIAAEYAGPLVKYYVPGLQTGGEEKLGLSGEHLAERCALFVIICLGETILTTGRTASEHMNSSLTFVVFFCAFSSTVLMWWIYFDYAQERVSEKVDGAAEPEKIAQSLFNYGHLPIVAGIILTAVGEDFSLSHSHDQATLRQTLAIIGGPVLFLAGAIGVKIASAHMRPVSHFVGIAILVGLLFLPGLPLYLLQIASAAVLLMVAIWEYLVIRRRSVTVSAA